MSKEKKKYIIEGGHKIEGVVQAQSAKNAIGKQLVATLLTDEPCVFFNVPKITEIDAILEMMRELGSVFEWIDTNTLKIQTSNIINTQVSAKYSGFNRIPILMIGPLLIRKNRASLPIVGGCRIGARPVDYHIAALKAMGANIELENDRYTAKSKELKGTIIELPYPSVGATENILLTATMSKGTTVIHNAAIEPEIMDTIIFLQKMGAIIHVDVDRKIIIQGVTKLRGTSHQPIVDRIEVASFAISAIALNGCIKVNNAQQEHMITLLNCLRKVGGGFRSDNDGITFFRDSDQISPIHIETDVHPGFMTDWQQPLVALLTQASGISILHETVYEDRFGYTETLVNMGANISLSSACLGSKPCRFKNKNYLHSCIVQGPTSLQGSLITIPDLRAGFAYIILALIAKGVSEISGVRYIERGYENIPEKLASIGVSIKVV